MGSVELLNYTEQSSIVMESTIVKGNMPVVDND